MAAGVIIGRVAVKVIPDTSDFKETLERDLNRLERNLDPVEIDITVDTDGVVREAKKARDQAEKAMKDLKLKVNMESENSVKRTLATLERELERLGEKEIPFKLDKDSLKADIDDLNDLLGELRKVTIEVDEANPASVKQAVDKINAQLAEVRKQKIEIEFDEGALTDQRNRLRDSMNDTYRQIRDTVSRELKTIQIGMDVDPVQAARTIRKIEVMLEAIEDAKMTITSDMDERSRFATLRKIQDMRDQIEDMKATIHPDLDGPLALSLAARLAVLARDRFVEYVPRVNRTAAATVGMALARMSGARLIGGYMRDLYNSIIQFDKAVPKIIGLSLAVGGLGIVGLTASSNLFALSASLASIAPAALALPGIFGGAAVGIGVLIAALKDFNAVFPDVQDTLARMQDNISTNFWAGAKASMREMLDVLLPALGRGFDDVATRLGNFSAKLTDALTATLAPALPGMFAFLSESIDVAAAAADNIVGIITTLGTVGSSYLPALAQWFVDITTQFDNFLKRSTESGEIFEWIDAGVDALQDLARVGGNAALILYDIAQAAQAAGGSSLGALADGLGRIREITQSEGFQTGLTDVFKAAHDAMGNIVSLSGPAVKRLFEELGKLATDVLPVIGATIGDVISGIATALTQPAVTDGIRDMFDGIMAGVQALDGIWVPLGEALGTLGPLVGDLARNIGEVLGAAIPPVAEALVAMGDAIAPLIPAMGELLVDAVNALTPVLAALAGAFVAIMEGGLLDLLVAGMQGLGAAITAIPSPILITVAAAVTALAVAAGIFSAAMTVATVATAGFGAVMAVVTSPILAVIAAIGALIAIGVLLYKNWDTIKAASKAAWTVIKAQVVEALSRMVEKIKSGWAAIKSEWDRALTQIKSSATSAWEQLKSIWNRGITAIKTAMTNASNALKAEWERIKTQVSTSARQAWEQAKAAFDSGVAAVKAKMASATSALKAEWERIKTQVSTSAKQAWEQAKAAFNTGVQAVVTVVSGLPGKIVSALGNLGGLLTGAGRQVIDGFISGLTSGFARVRSTLGSLTSMLPDWKGPRDRDKNLLVEAGQLVMGGFIDGLESQYSVIKESLKGLTDDMAESFGEPLTADLKANLPQTNVRKGLVGGVKTAVVEQTTVANGRTLIYNAAPGSSLGSEEDLFAAADRGRMVGW